MGRAPSYEKLGMKKGPWSEEEDRILTSFIHRNGHGNWRSLPKRAGLLRCGKSCRLRWVNYLKPDIKRGNFTKEEEDTIIRLHETLGNRWSAIAGELPGRTDNEIKNVWHSHLKKRLQHSSSSMSETSNESSSSNGFCRPTSITNTDVEPQTYGDLSLEDFSPSEHSIMQEVEESIWSEEFTVPFLENPIQHVEDDLNFLMDLSTDGHFRYF